MSYHFTLATHLNDVLVFWPGDVLLYGADEGEMLDENPHYKKHHRVPQFFVVFGLWQDIWNKLAARNGSGIFQMECWYSVFICEG